MIITAIVAIVAGIVLIYLLPQRLDIVAGLALGVVGGLIVMRLKVLAIYKFAQNPEKPPVKGGFHGLAVMVITLAIAIGVNKYSDSNIFFVWTVFAGLFLPNIVLMIDGFFRPNALNESGTEDASEA